MADELTQLLTRLTKHIMKAKTDDEYEIYKLATQYFKSEQEKLDLRKRMWITKDKAIELYNIVLSNAEDDLVISKRELVEKVGELLSPESLKTLLSYSTLNPAEPNLCDCLRFITLAIASATEV